MKTVIKIAAKALIVGIFTYIVIWSAVYAIITGADFVHYFDYMKWSWSGGGELPAFIHGVALISSLAGIIIFIWGNRKKRMKR